MKLNNLRSLRVLRHAPINAPAPGVVYGQSDFELIDGYEALVKNFANDNLREKELILVTSDLKRALTTSRCIAENVSVVEIITDPDLRERNFGEWEGLHIDNVMQSNPHCFDSEGILLDDVVPASGESGAGHRVRIENFLARLNSSPRFKDKDVLLVSHGNTIRMMFSILLELDFKYLLKNLNFEPLTILNLKPCTLPAKSTQCGELPMHLPNFTIDLTSSQNIESANFEVVERKGQGHPDTISDSIAEEISRCYSKHCMTNYGVILRHMVDKIAVQGGATHVKFGGGEFRTPIKVSLNGRFTGSFCGQQIPYREMAHTAAKRVLSSILCNFDPDNTLHLEIRDSFHSSEGPGVVYDKDGCTRNDRHNFFTVACEENYGSIHMNHQRANDTSTCTGIAPFSTLESMVIFAEEFLNSNIMKRRKPWIGTDIKVMGKRVDRDISLTLCVPLISTYTPNLAFYNEALCEIKEELLDVLPQHVPGDYNLEIDLNTRDNVEKDDFYLTLTGSALESGDEGAVGRGNRSYGFIPFTRVMSTEAPCGKNPVYHVGKVYTVLSHLMARAIYSATGLHSNIFLTSQMGRPMKDPWHVAVKLHPNAASYKLEQSTEVIVRDIVSYYLQNHILATELAVEGGVNLAF